jgi:hypothetical protein
MNLFSKLIALYAMFFVSFAMAQKIEFVGLDISIGQPAAKIQEVLKTTISPIEFKSPTNPTLASRLPLGTRGMQIYFDQSGNAAVILLTAPFKGNFSGVVLGDSIEGVRSRLGDPSSKNLNNDGREHYFYNPSDLFHVQFSFKAPTKTLETVILRRYDVVTVSPVATVIPLSGPNVSASTAANNQNSNIQTSPLSLTQAYQMNEGLPVQLGNSVAQVQRALQTDAQPEPLVNALSVFTNSASSGYSLKVRTKGITVFFDKEDRANNIKIEAPFQGSISGVRIGDSFYSMKQRLGNPAKPPFKYGNSDSYIYYTNDNFTTRFDVNQRGDVETIFIFK